ncbi:lipid III flippase [Bacteroidia bacterium]|nr:lipid III flippase [Bacteroidia bacterium]
MKEKLNVFTNKLKTSTLAKDSLWALMGSVSSNVLSLTAGIVVARFLGKDVFGEYGMVKITLLEMAVFSTFGLGYTITKYIAQYKKKHPEYIRQIVRFSTYSTLIISGIIALSVLIFAQNLAIFMKAQHLATILRISAIAIIFNAITTVQTGILSGFAAFKIIAINKFISGIIIFLLSVILTYFYGIEGAIIALTISLLCNVIINYISVQKVLVAYTVIQKNRQLNKEILRFSLPIALQESSFAIMYWLTTFLIVKLSNYGELGIYNAALQWGAIIAYIPSTLSNVMLSYFSASINNIKTHNKTVNRMLLLVGLTTLAPFLFVFVFSRFITSLYGNTFISMNSILSIVMFTAITNAVANVYKQEFISQERNWLLFILRIIRDTFIIIFSIAMVKIFTDKGIAFLFALVNLIISIIYCLLLHFYYRRTFDVESKM